MTPASTVTVFETTSSSRMRLRRDRESTSSLLPRCGTPAPTSPVLPPCGTMGVRVSLASRMMRETSSTLPGRSTIGVSPG